VTMDRDGDGKINAADLHEALKQVNEGARQAGNKLSFQHPVHGLPLVQAP
jgi:Ca2+-binding EF-hand superfamily protein